jgi:hypothetical protein
MITIYERRATSETAEYPVQKTHLQHYSEAQMSSPILMASRFERAHQLFMHCLIVSLALLTYLRDGEDVGWRLVKNQGAETRPVERATFLVATVLIGVGAYLCTSSRRVAEDLPDWRVSRSKNYLGQFVYAVGLSTLLPMAGFLILTIGEGARIIRLSVYNDRQKERISCDGLSKSASPAITPTGRWRTAARAEAVQWGLLVSMIVFTVTLRDAYADYLIGASVFFAALVNLPLLLRRATPQGVP